MRERSLLFLALGLLSVSTGCGQSKSEEVTAARTLMAVEAERTVSLKVPKLLSVSTPVLAATDHLGVGARAVIEQFGGSNPPIASLGGTLRLEPDAIVNDVWSAGPVDLRDRVRVRGTVHATQVSSGNNVVVENGQDSAPVLLPPSMLSWGVTYPDQPATQVNLEPDQSRVVAPGRYGTVRLASRSTLKLSSGTYYLDQVLQPEPQAIIELNQDKGPVIIYVAGQLQLRGDIRSTTGAPPDVLVAYLGSETVTAETPFNGALIAPSGSIVLRDVAGGHTGYFFARSVDVDAGAKVRYRAPLALVAAANPDVGKCAQMIPPPSGTSAAEAIRYQKEINRYCSMRGDSDCKAEIVARTNVDFADAAFSLVGEVITPAKYLSLVRDRTRKERAAEDNPPLAAAICSQPDDDRDLVPNGSDACPGTPPATSTFDNGCTDDSLPPAPSAADVSTLFEHGGIMLDPRCEGAALLPENVAGAFYRPAQPALGTYILGSRVTNQPVGCPVWYFFDIEEYTSQGPQSRYMVAFRENEETTALVGLAQPVPAGHIQFNPLPTNAGTRGQLGSAGGTYGVRFRVRTMNGGGMRSAWSSWKITTNSDCLELGFQCGG